MTDYQPVPVSVNDDEEAGIAQQSVVSPTEVNASSAPGAVWASDEDPNKGPGDMRRAYVLWTLLALLLFVWVLFGALGFALPGLPPWTLMTMVLATLPGVLIFCIVYVPYQHWRLATLNRAAMWVFAGCVSVFPVIFFEALIQIVGLIVLIIVMVLLDVKHPERTFASSATEFDEGGNPKAGPFWASFLSSVLVAGSASLVEELAKWCICVLIFHFHVSPSISAATSPYAGVVYAVAGVVGFATLEDMEYGLLTQRTLLNAVLTPLFRGILPLHYFTVVIMSVRMARNKFAMDARPYNWFQVMWLPFLLHFLYDFSIFIVDRLIFMTGHYQCEPGQSIPISGVNITQNDCRYVTDGSDAGNWVGIVIMSLVFLGNLLVGLVLAFSWSIRLLRDWREQVASGVLGARAL